ncbi:endolytic transglycosylase MltG [Halobacillus naozhouensis]|uniref:Endolytic transglycosylase MltG n=1 Tax=Halobacillus naozhouensis TaxID=554880 RepID=A0ABY8ITC9_9BACI|nr:endolytic transglycosylase MltG [Halobacillus naozhouensis]WFT73262.1 endolytic transglycosylase MltG [Halobacillus naozhouensis]
MKQTVRSFSIGLMAATLMLSIFYWVEPREMSGKTPQLSENDMISKLKSDGYHIFTEAQLENVKNEAKATQETTKKTDTPEKRPGKVTFSIASGMSSTEISQMLADAGLIDDVEAFDEYMRNQELSRYIQIGEYEVPKGMTIEQTADIITSK